MEGNEVPRLKSGDFLTDLDINLSLRSSEADSKFLLDLEQVIVTSVEDYLDTRVAFIERDIHVNIKAGKKLNILSSKFIISD